METIDLNKVAGFQALDNEGNVLGIVSMEQLTDTVAMRIAESLSGGDRMLLPAVEPMAVTAAATGSDKMETALGETTDPAYVRVIDKSGNSAKQGISSLATVVGGLLPPAANNTKGIVRANSSNFSNPETIYGNSDEIKTGEFKTNFLSLLIDIETPSGENNSIWYISKSSDLPLSAIKIAGEKTVTFSIKGSELYISGVRYCYVRVFVLSDSSSFTFN
mgnify:CR=1 FL=1